MRDGFRGEVAWHKTAAHGLWDRTTGRCATRRGPSFSETYRVPFVLVQSSVQIQTDEQVLLKWFCPVGEPLATCGNVDFNLN